MSIRSERTKNYHNSRIKFSIEYDSNDEWTEILDWFVSAFGYKLFDTLHNPKRWEATCYAGNHSRYQIRKHFYLEFSNPEDAMAFRLRFS